jgi:large subunit ribosomal protein L19
MSSPIIQQIDAQQRRSEVPPFRPGDTVRVSVRIREGEKERVQDFEGLVIRRRGEGVSETFTVRRTSFGIGMERIFMLHSPRLEAITVTRYGRVRRSRLYYLRDLSGKAARIPDLRDKPGRGTKAPSVVADDSAKKKKRGAKAKAERRARAEAEATPKPKKAKKKAAPKKGTAK